MSTALTVIDTNRLHERKLLKVNQTVEEGEQGLMSKDPCLTSPMEEVVKEPLRTPCHVGSLEQQQADRRQSSRNSKLTVKAYISMSPK